MAVSVSLSVSPNSPASGQTITATYVVSGNGGSAAGSATLTGSVKIGGTTYPCTAELTLGATPAAAETFAVPTAPGLAFTKTPAANVFTAVAP
jgi:hypothetical protein